MRPPRNTRRTPYATIKVRRIFCHIGIATDSPRRFFPSLANATTGELSEASNVELRLLRSFSRRPTRTQGYVSVEPNRKTRDLSDFVFDVRLSNRHSNAGERESLHGGITPYLEDFTHVWADGNHFVFDLWLAHFAKGK